MSKITVGLSLHRPEMTPWIAERMRQHTDSLAYHVCRAEQAATGALLAYYQTVVTGAFEDAVDSVIRFARVDAERFRLRDSLRAQELARRIPKYRSSQILEKNELDERLEAFPHLRDELACIRAVRQLSLEDCKHLFPLIRRVGTLEARGMITEFLLKRNQQ